jgi:hypothetical protein
MGREICASAIRGVFVKSQRLNHCLCMILHLSTPGPIHGAHLGYCVAGLRVSGIRKSDEMVLRAVVAKRSPTVWL